MKKILLLDTSIATQNVGDTIINKSIEINWPELFSSNFIVRFPSHTPPYLWWQQHFFPRKCNLAKHTDYKFLCGTNALYTNMFRPIPQWNINLLNASMLQGTVLLGVGSGINSSNINFYTKRLYSKVLSHDFVHSVRDDYTEEMLNKLGYKVINTGCPTIWGFTSDFCRQIPESKADSVIFTLTGYQSDVENDKMMVRLLQQNYNHLYFWPQTFEDLNYLKSLGRFEYQVIPPNLESYDKALEMDVDYVGNRLHGGIRALQHQKRSLIIAIDYRAENMLRNFSLPIISREKIKYDLEDIINSKTSVAVSGLDFEKIANWKSQFKFGDE